MFFLTLQDFLTSWREPLLLKGGDLVMIKWLKYEVHCSFLNNETSWQNNDQIFRELWIGDKNHYASEIYGYDAILGSFPESKPWDYEALTKIYIDLCMLSGDIPLSDDEPKNSVIIDFMNEDNKTDIQGWVIFCSKTKKRKEVFKDLISGSLPFLSKRVKPYFFHKWESSASTSRFYGITHRVLFESYDSDIDSVDQMKKFMRSTDWECLVINADEFVVSTKNTLIKIYDWLWATDEDKKELSNLYSQQSI